MPLSPTSIHCCTGDPRKYKNCEGKYKAINRRYVENPKQSVDLLDLLHDGS